MYNETRVILLKTMILHNIKEKSGQVRVRSRVE